MNLKLYTVNSLRNEVWPYGRNLLQANIKAGVIPQGRLRNGSRIWTQEEAILIRDAVLDGKLVPVRNTNKAA